MSPATNTSDTDATVSGNVTSNSGAAVTERGFVYGMSDNPSVGGTGVTKVTAGSGSGTFSATITGLTANTIYHVRAYASNGTEITYGEDVKFTTLISTGVVEKPTDRDFLIFPNPNSGIAFIYTPESESINCIEVFSIQGKQVLNVDHPQNNDLDLSGFPNGIYLVKIQSKSGFYNQKIVKH